MHANVTEGKDYQERGIAAANMLREFPGDLNSVNKHDLEIQKKRAEVHARLETMLGSRIAVANDNDDQHVAAFITTANKKIHIVEQTLDNPDFATYAINHEKEHGHNEIFDLTFSGNLEPDQFDPLNSTMQENHINIETMDWIEGFNDLLNRKKHGANDQSGYVNEEVPAAEKLEELCLEKTGTSLVQAFDQGNKPLFYSRLKQLSDTLLLEKTIESLKVGNNTLNGVMTLDELKTATKARAKTLKLPVGNQLEARRITKKLVTEILELKKLDRFFHVSEDNSSGKMPASILTGTVN